MAEESRHPAVSVSGAGKLVLWPSAGDCANCGQPIHEVTMAELTYTGTGEHMHLRPVTILAHTGSGHERCEGRDTVAERLA